MPITIVFALSQLPLIQRHSTDGGPFGDLKREKADEGVGATATGAYSAAIAGAGSSTRTSPAALSVTQNTEKNSISGSMP